MMSGKTFIALAVLLLSLANLGLSRPQPEQSVVQVTTSDIVRPGELANIYLHWLGSPPSVINTVYASCLGPNSSSHHHIIGRFAVNGAPPQRLAWVVPEGAQADGCVYVYGGQQHSAARQLLGKSDPVHLQRRTRKRSAANLDVPLLKDFDSLGTWFDGVAAIKQKTESNGGVAASNSPKDARIAIVGGGISGLATALMLDSVGLHNWEIIEASDRVGGRFRTKYVVGTQEWAEMGPMRLPYSVTYKDDNETLR